MKGGLLKACEGLWKAFEGPRSPGNVSYCSDFACLVKFPYWFFRGPGPGNMGLHKILLSFAIIIKRFKSLLTAFKSQSQIEDNKDGG